MFWVTLRQRIQEIRQRRQSAVITDMAAPLQLTVSAAASGEYLLWNLEISKSLNLI
jgi:hypothetical protein